MTELRRIREAIRAELIAHPEPDPERAFPVVDAALDEFRRRTLPSEAVIEAMTADTEPIELPDGWEQRAAERRARLAGSLLRDTKSLGSLLREARQARGVSLRVAARAVELAPSVWQSVEDDEAPSALLAVAPDLMARLTSALGIARQQLGRSLRASLAASAGVGFGYRPRQLPEDIGPAVARPRDQNERLRSWLVDYLEADV